MKSFLDFEYTMEEKKIKKKTKMRSRHDIRKEVTIHKYHGNQKNIVVPYAMEQITVVELRETFTDQVEIETVELPRYLKVISADTFRGCENLKNITIPSTMDYIGKGSFANCLLLENVFFYKTPFFVEKIEFGEGVFENCPKIYDKDGFAIIQNYFVSYNGTEENITLPYGVKKIAEFAFDRNKTIKSVVIPETVTEIGWYAFSNCENLSNITLSNEIQIIKHGTFQGCENLQEITIPESVNTIEKGAFTNCDSLGKVVFSHCPKTIQKGTFTYTSKMREILLKSGEEIDARVIGTFVESDYEQYLIDLLSKWTEISQRTRDYFINQWTDKLENPRYRRQHHLRTWIFMQQTAKEMKVYFEAGCHLEMPELEGYLEHSIAKGNTTETALLLAYKNEAFDKTFLDSENSRKEMLEFGLQPLTVKELAEKWAYHDENRLLTITGYLGEEISEILPEHLGRGKKIYKIEKSEVGFPNLEQLFLPEGLEIIGDEVFFQASLKEVYLPSTVKEIGYKAFSESELTQVMVKTEKILLDRSVFSGCKQLNKVIFIDTVLEIPFATFCDCISLREIILPDGLKKIGRKAFSGCKSLQTMNFPSSLQVVDTFAFEECVALEEILLPSLIERLNSRAFLHCTGLKRVILTSPAMCEKIHQNAFSGCSSLEFVGEEGGTNLLDKFQV